MKILYALNVAWHLGEITECEVEKETEKTYTIKINGWGNNRVLKSNMVIHNYRLFETYKEAQANLKEILCNRIEIAERKIKSAKAEIEKYNLMLDDMRKEDEGE